MLGIYYGFCRYRQYNKKGRKKEYDTSRKEVYHIMERKITLGSEQFIGMRDKIIAGTHVDLVFESIEYPIDELRVTVSNGAMARRHDVKNGKLDITQYCVKASIVEVVVELILRGSVAKKWVLEPFVVRENGGAYVLIPEFTLLRREHKMIKKALKEMNTKIKQTM